MRGIGGVWIKTCELALAAPSSEQRAQLHANVPTPQRKPLGLSHGLNKPERVAASSGRSENL